MKRCLILTAVLAGTFLYLSAVATASQVDLLKNAQGQMNTHKLAMSVAWLKEKIMASGSNLTDEACLVEVHLMLLKLGINVSLEEVKRISAVEQKVSNTVTDIDVIEVGKRTFSKSQREPELRSTISFEILSPDTVPQRLSSSDGEKAMYPSQERRKPVTKAQATSHDPFTALVVFIAQKADHQLAISGSSIGMSRNRLTLNALVSMGLPQVSLKGDWEKSSVEELAQAIKRRISFNDLKRFEENSQIFEGSL